MKNTRTTHLLFAILLSSTLFSQDKNQVIPLWTNGAPGFENRKNEPELAKDWYVKNIHNPSITVFLPPKEKANGAAVLICPGGGFRALVYNSEGADAAAYFNDLGVTAFVLKYRLFREENSPYTQLQSEQDGRRAMRLVRKQAAQWSIDTARIGVVGFSAGGELAGWIGFNSPKEKLVRLDSTDDVSARANFVILVYPGPLVVPSDGVAGAPPLFMVAANDDECCSEPIIQLLQLYRKEKLKAEVHIYAQGNHAFNMGKRSKLLSIQAWPQRMVDWMIDSELIKVK